MDVKKPSLSDIAKELGFDPSNARLIPARVKVEPFTDDNDAVKALVALASEGVEAAGPITDDGRPRMLKLTAWIAHSGPANRNRDAFLEEDRSDTREAGGGSISRTALCRDSLLGP